MTSAVDRDASKSFATRELILDTAMAMFGEKGYRGTSVRDIAARCSMTHPGLLYHFPTKEALLLAVLTRRDDLDGQEYPVTHQPGRVALASLVGTARTNQGKRGIVELFTTLAGEATSSDHPAHTYFKLRYVHLIRFIEQAFADIAADGGLRDGVDPKVAAKHIIALMDGLQVQWLLDDGATDMPGILLDHVNSQLVVPLEIEETAG